MRGQAGRKTRPHVRFANKFPGHGYGHRSLTSEYNVALFDSQLRVLLISLAFFDMLFMDVSTTGHLQTFRRLVQEINVFTDMI